MSCFKKSHVLRASTEAFNLIKFRQERYKKNGSNLSITQLVDYLVFFIEVNHPEISLVELVEASNNYHILINQSNQVFCNDFSEDLIPVHHYDDSEVY